MWLGSYFAGFVGGGLGEAKLRQSTHTHTNLHTMYFYAFFIVPLCMLASAHNFPYSQSLQKTDTEREKSCNKKDRQ